jgi:hypothetical protein
VLAPSLFTAPLTRYAARFHAAIGDRHHVASPLGAWMLLALAAPAATGGLRQELEAVLGTEADAAAALAAVLLVEAHPLVHCGAAAWHRPAFRTDALLGWLRSLPGEVEQGDVPTQAAADGWAREHTYGLVERFPLELTPDVVLVLAAALATRISWMVPFDVVDARALGDESDWSRRLTSVLRTPVRFPSTAFITSTAHAGDVAVHVAPARDGAGFAQSLAVISVIAARDVPSADVMAGAYEIATDFAAHRNASRPSLFDVPLGEGHSWTITEAPDDGSGRSEQWTVALPAWSAKDDHDLLAHDLGFDAALHALAALLPPGDYRYMAKQSVIARYDRRGFEAAAITAMGIAVSRRVRLDGMRRVAELRFGHPFAVVAVALDGRYGGSTPSFGPWHGVPVFSAWVAEPEDAEPEGVAQPIPR